MAADGAGLGSRLGAGAISPGGQTPHTQGSAVGKLPSNSTPQKYDGVNSAVSSENVPQKHPSAMNAVDRLYRNNEGVQPYPRRNQPPSMGGGAI